MVYLSVINAKILNFELPSERNKNGRIPYSIRFPASLSERSEDPMLTGLQGALISQNFEIKQ
jgi:hypothetical protein